VEVHTIDPYVPFASIALPENVMDDPNAAEVVAGPVMVTAERVTMPL